MNENQKAVARLLLFEQKAQEIYTEMRSRDLCDVGDEIIVGGGPKGNRVTTWATMDHPDKVIMLLTDKTRTQ